MVTHKLALTEAALTQIRHARTDLVASAESPGRPGRLRTDYMGASTDPRTWLAEAAVLRLISAVEAYVDAASEQRMSELVDTRDPVALRRLQEILAESSAGWDRRNAAYEEHHGFTLGSRDGWGQVRAGAELRNCLVHGLGNLTAKQRRNTQLAAKVRSIDVVVGGNRMHLSRTTVAKLADACAAFVRHVDASFA